jgi:hypothetical protein
MKTGVSQKEAARQAGVSAETLRRFQKANTTSQREGGRWVIVDTRPVSVVMATRGKVRGVTVSHDAAMLSNFSLGMAGSTFMISVRRHGPTSSPMGRARKARSFRQWKSTSGSRLGLMTSIASPIFCRAWHGIAR